MYCEDLAQEHKNELKGQWNSCFFWLTHVAVVVTLKFDIVMLKLCIKTKLMYLCEKKRKGERIILKISTRKKFVHFGLSSHHATGSQWIKESEVFAGMKGFSFSLISFAHSFIETFLKI